MVSYANTALETLFVVEGHFAASSLTLALNARTQTYQWNDNATGKGGSFLGDCVVMIRELKPETLEWILWRQLRL